MPPTQTNDKTTTPRQYLYFGYIIKDTWLLEYAVRTHLCDNLTLEAIKESGTLEENGILEEDVDIVGSTISAALIDVLAKARITFSSKLGSVLSYAGEPKHCIVLATNNPSDNLPVPPPEKYARLKEILRTTTEPKWYLASS